MIHSPELVLHIGCESHWSSWTFCICTYNRIYSNQKSPWITLNTQSWTGSLDKNNIQSWIGFLDLPPGCGTEYFRVWQHSRLNDITYLLNGSEHLCSRRHSSAGLLQHGDMFLDFQEKAPDLGVHTDLIQLL
jgi:hypothetical protein